MVLHELSTYIVLAIYKWNSLPLGLMRAFISLNSRAPCPIYLVTTHWGLNEGINWKTASWKAQSTQPRQLLFTINSIKDYLRVAFEAYFTRNGFQNHWNTFLLYLRWKELCIFTVSLNVYCWALDQAFEGVSVCHDIPTHTTWDKCTLPFAELSALDSNCKIRYLGSILLRG